MDISEIINFAIQLGLGIAVTVVIYVISLVVMSTDGLITVGGFTQALPQQTRILTGVIDATSVKKRVYNTVLPTAENYLSIRRSVNRIGGAQYSYSFWMYVDNIAWIHKNTSACNIPDEGGDTNYTKTNNPNLYPLFIKGDKRCYQYTVEPYGVGTSAGTKIGNKAYYQGRYVMSPMVAIGDPTAKEMFVYFNTLDKVNQHVVLKRSPNMDSTLRHNVPSLVEKRWVMYTFVFMDYIPISDFENGIVVKSYVNDTLYQMDKIPGTLRDNDGELSILPDGAPGSDSSYTSKLMLSTMDYYNYALSDEQVVKRFNAGVNQNPNFDVASPKDSEVLNLGVYNKLDVYNL